MVKSWQAIVAALVIFCTGTVSGFLLAHQYLRRQNPDPALASSAFLSMGPSWARTEFLRRAQQQLDLTEQQRERIDQILASGQSNLRVIWEPIAPQSQAELRQIRERILAELNPRQQAQFDDLTKQKYPWRRDSGKPRELFHKREHSGQSSPTDTQRNPGSETNCDTKPH
jgi:hypothetical protein